MNTDGLWENEENKAVRAHEIKKAEILKERDVDIEKQKTRQEAYKVSPWLASWDAITGKIVNLVGYAAWVSAILLMAQCSCECIW